METKKEKFIRLAESRTNNCVKNIKLIGNLSNKNNYEYSKKQVDEMFRAIENELKQAKSLFYSELNQTKTEEKFKFSR